MYATKFGDVKVYPFNNKGDAHMELYQYFKDVGVYKSLHMYNSKVIDVINKWKKVLAKEGIIKTSCTEPHTHQQNDSEQEIKIIKSKILQKVRASNMPVPLWGVAVIYEAEIIFCTPIDNYPELEI